MCSPRGSAASTGAGGGSLGGTGDDPEAGCPGSPSGDDGKLAITRRPGAGCAGGAAWSSGSWASDGRTAAIGAGPEAGTSGQADHILLVKIKMLCPESRFPRTHHMLNTVIDEQCACRIRAVA